MYYEQKLSHPYCTHSSYIVCALCDSMPCRLVNIYSTFEEYDCFVTRKKKKFNRAFFQVFFNEGKQLIPKHRHLPDYKESLSTAYKA